MSVSESGLYTLIMSSRKPELASPRSHPRIFGRNFREPHLIKGNRALPPWPLPFPLNAARR
ncbi:hypothetical protein [Brucella abortus]|uniref:hypothetical protein n=1 Tax=Brucella abortus TaxID=235 RepID=UPI003F500F74